MVGNSYNKAWVTTDKVNVNSKNNSKMLQMVKVISGNITDCDFILLLKLKLN